MTKNTQRQPTVPTSSPPNVGPDSVATPATEPDPRDGRRTLLSPPAEPSDRMKVAQEAPLGPALAAATTDPDEALALLERLSSLLR
ncbi:hypothetical protein [Streptomyces sasae]|uniref:hypothetical protein n=1 Tax=Streptomyces sasae TaxID=1266772 RepID=UPI0029313284|nr:hypothetical protein [Streptomyces sasae]